MLLPRSWNIPPDLMEEYYTATLPSLARDGRGPAREPSVI
jgi:hypothetical protein